MHRSRFLLGATTLVTAGFVSTDAYSSQDDPVIARLRRGDFGGTPFSRVPVNQNAGLSGGSTRETIRLLQAGAHAEKIGRMHSLSNRVADLYRVEVEQQQMSLLIARKGDELTDIAARPSYGLPRGSRGPEADAFDALMKRMQPNLVAGRPWTGLVTSAVDLAVTAAWPERDALVGGGSGSGPAVQAYFAFKSTRSDWTRLGSERQADVIEAMGSAVARLYGLTRPNSGLPSSEIIVGITEAEALMTDSPRLRRIGPPGSYLLQKTVAFAPWRSDAV